MVAPLSSAALPRARAPGQTPQPHGVAQVVVVGSLHMDVVVSLARMPQAGETVLAQQLRYLPGGKGGNQAVACARHGAHVTLFGCVGRDAHGNTLRLALLDAGVDMEYVAVHDSAPTGAAVVLVQGGDNRICVVPGASALLALPEEGLLLALAQADFVMLQSEVPDAVLAQVLEAAASTGCRVVWNVSPVRDVPAHWWPQVHTVVVNAHEAAACSGMPVDSPQTAALAGQALLAQGVRQVVVTLGAQGAVAVDGTQTPARTTLHAGLPLPVVDTTGAGDTLAGAMVTRLAEGHDLGDAVAWGIRAASLCMGREGAQPSIPSRAQVEALAQRTASV